MNEELAKKLLEELIPHLESMETQGMAILQLLRDKGIVKEKQFAPYLDRAGDTSSVKWLATRLRMEHLISMAAMDDSKSQETTTRTSSDQKTQPEASEAAQETASDAGSREHAAASTANDGQQQAEASEHLEEPAAQETARDAGGQEDAEASAANDGPQHAAEKPSPEKALKPGKETAESTTNPETPKTEEDKGSRAA